MGGGGRGGGVVGFAATAFCVSVQGVYCLRRPATGAAGDWTRLSSAHQASALRRVGLSWLQRCLSYGVASAPLVSFSNLHEGRVVDQGLPGLQATADPEMSGVSALPVASLSPVISPCSWSFPRYRRALEFSSSRTVPISKTQEVRMFFKMCPQEGNPWPHGGSSGIPVRAGLFLF